MPDGHSLWKPIEINFSGKGTYDNPYVEVDLRVKYRSPSGNIVEMTAFWDGGNSWKVRFSPWEQGTWFWESTSEPLDDGLHARTGSFHVNLVDRDHDIYQHGFLKIHPSGRGFCHWDGTPFFWLADTAWSVSAAAEMDEWREYLATRSVQGFNLVQINSLPQHDSSVKNYRLPFIIESDVWDLDRPQPEYFQVLDSYLVQAMHAGILPALVVLWFDYVPETNLWWPLAKKAVFTVEQAARYARYLTARTAAYGTVYIISGDTDFETPASMAVYDAAALMVRQTNPYATLITAHINGEELTPLALNERPWLDFHMYQSGHKSTALERASSCALFAHQLEPARPVINSEPLYEGRYYLEPEKQPPGRDLLRRIFWTSWFSGATAGITYGAFPVWAWDRPPLKPDWRTTLQATSAGDIVQLKRFLERLPWWSFMPAANLSTESDVLFAETGDKTKILAYSYNLARQLILNIDRLPLQATWFNPATGLQVSAKYRLNDGSIKIEKPGWDEDAVLSLELPQY
jgi:hypothetical protein